LIFQIVHHSIGTHLQRLMDFSATMVFALRFWLGCYLMQKWREVLCYARN